MRKQTDKEFSELFDDDSDSLSNTIDRLNGNYYDALNYKVVNDPEKFFRKISSRR